MSESERLAKEAWDWAEVAAKEYQYACEQERWAKNEVKLRHHMREQKHKEMERLMEIANALAEKN